MWFASLLALVSPAEACGPDLPLALVQLDDEALWAAPVADFAVEMRRLAPPDVPWQASTLDVLDAEAADLRTVLPAGPETDAFVDAWTAWRRGKGSRPVVPEAVPDEWVDYATAAVAWRGRSRDAAIGGFERLLARPEAERPTRTVWATWMLARASGRPEDFQAVRALVSAGWPDPLGLAAASLGEEALAVGAYERAGVDLYLQQVATGDPSAAVSLNLVARDVLSNPSDWADDPLLRRILTAWIVAHGGPWPSGGEVARTRQWLALVEGATDRLDDADRLALAAYQIGDVDTTSRWLALSEPTPLASWLRAKLALREGRRDEAEAHLAAAGAAFADEAWPAGSYGERSYWGTAPGAEAWGEAGVLRLADSDWVGALDAFVASDSWYDAAYVAERVLTTDELVAFVERVHPEPVRPRAMEPDWGWPMRSRVRELLARRLTREGRMDEARAYWPPELQPIFERYAAGLRVGADPTRPSATRARAWWDAARIARVQGLELLGTTVEPDYSMWSGDFEPYHRVVETRFDGQHHASAAEIERVTASAPSPDLRWHYRYTAAELAWDAAALLPEADPLAGEILCTAGRWHYVRDPETADRFGRELRRRDYARAWFPMDCADLQRVQGPPPRRGRGPGILALAGIALLGSLVRLRSP